MNAFLGFAMLAAIIVGAASVAGIIFALIKHRPKKKWAVCMICGMVVFAASLCTYEVSTPKENRPASSAAVVKQEAPAKGARSSAQEETASAAQQPVCPVAGIGDTSDLFSSKYGDGKDNGAFRIYQNDKILVMEVNGFAYNITVNEKSGKKMELDNISGFLPSDMKMVKEYRDGSETYPKFIYIGESAALQKIFPDDKGRFIVIQKVFANEGKTVFVIGTGENP
jgi:hypothetical protein